MSVYRRVTTPPTGEGAMLIGLLLACQAPSIGSAASHSRTVGGTPSITADALGAIRSPIAQAPPVGEPVAEPIVDPVPDPVVIPPVVARLSASVVAGEFPLVVDFDAGTSELGSGDVTFLWSFGDGLELTGDGDAAHTYVGKGDFVATVTVVDLLTGSVSVASVDVDVETPACPASDAPVTWGEVEDGSLTELSGIVESIREPGVFWVQQDSGNSSDLTVLDENGETLSTQTLDDELVDFEDIQVAVDPATGTSTLFLADIGDNGLDRSEVAVWIAPEPDPLTDGDLDPLRMALIYPYGARNAETLLVDPVTLDIFIVTKKTDDDASVYVKRAPHVGEGPFVMESLGSWGTLDMTATGGDISPDGSRIVVRDYTDVARLFFRDGYLPLEDAFDAAACEIEIQGEYQGEAIAFTSDGGLVTVSEGQGVELYYIGL